MLAHTLPESGAVGGRGKFISVLYGQTERFITMGKRKSKLEMHL